MRTTVSYPDAPKTLEDFFSRLQETSDLLPKRLRQCATFVTDSPERIAVSTVAEWSELAEVPPSAVIRFCQVYGFSGFSEMQRLFRDSLALTQWPDYSTRLKKIREEHADGPISLLAEFGDAGRLSLEKLMQTADPKVFDEAIETLTSAECIHLVGFRRSFPVSAYLAYAFDKMEVPCVLHTAVGRLGESKSLRSGDVMLAISFAPYTLETVELAGYARSQGIAVVAVTDNMASPLYRIGSTTITVSEPDVGSFRPLVATLTLAMSLAVSVGSRYEARAAE